MSLTDADIQHIREGHPSIAFIVLDSCRYDSMMLASHSNMDALGLHFRKTYSPANYTLPAHVAFFKGTSMPSSPRLSGIYNHRHTKVFSISRSVDATSSTRRETLIELPEAGTILEGLRIHGYRTIGIGGVDWFDVDVATSAFWKEWFEDFYFDDDFRPGRVDSLTPQIELLKTLGLRESDSPVFFFLNVSVTHIPYMGYGLTPQGQARTVEHFDALLPDILEHLPRPLLLMILSDHGDALGEDGIHAHHIFHEKVFEIPFDMVYIRDRSQVLTRGISLSARQARLGDRVRGKLRQLLLRLANRIG